jgi:hypothetical protein
MLFAWLSSVFGRFHLLRDRLCVFRRKDYRLLRRLLGGLFGMVSVLLLGGRLRSIGIFGGPCYLFGGWLCWLGGLLLLRSWLASRLIVLALFIIFLIIIVQ